MGSNRVNTRLLWNVNCLLYLLICKFTIPSSCFSRKKHVRLHGCSLSTVVSHENLSACYNGLLYVCVGVKGCVRMSRCGTATVLNTNMKTQKKKCWKQGKKAPKCASFSLCIHTKCSCLYANMDILYYLKININSHLKLH